MKVSDLIKKLAELDPDAQIMSFRGNDTCAETFDFEYHRVYELNDRGLFSIIDEDSVTECEYVEAMKKHLVKRRIII